MNPRLVLLSAAAAFALPLAAAVPPAPKILPQDTLALATVPDWGRATADFKASSGGLMWADPAMKAFRDNFEKKFSEKVLGSLEKDLGIKAADYLALLQGQLTLAVVQNDWRGEEGTEPGWLAIIDTKDKSAELKKQLEEVRKKLADAKKPVKAEKIRDLEFLSVSVDLPAKEADEDAADAKDKKPRKMNIVFGQADSALVVGDSVKAVEKVVARLTGGSVPTIGEDAGFQSSEAAWFKQAYSYAWVNWTPIYAVIAKQPKAGEGADAMGVDPKAALKAVGLDGLRTISLAATLNGEGSGITLSLAVPEGQRVGLFKMLAPTPKDSSPLPFIPADAVRFWRWRVDGQKTWAAFEQTLANISPQLAGFVGMMVSTAGKDKDPNFDVKKSVVGNLGDDVISWGKAASGKSMMELMDPPTVTLVGSADAEGLATGMRVVGSMLTGGGGEELKDREFNGKKIRAVRLQPAPGQKLRKLEIAASGGYVAMGTVPALLEEYLRSADGGGKSLRDDPAIARAAEKVGGMGSGYFGYENQRESMRTQWEFMRTGAFDNMMDQNGGSEWRELFDFKSLPAFDQVSKYFGIAVYSGSADAQGLNLKFYGPRPR